MSEEIHSHEHWPQTENYDLDLGDGHWLQWLEYRGQVVGGVIMHLTETGKCMGAFWVNDTYLKAVGRTAPIWSLHGSLDHPTLMPSFDCHCGQSHGWVKKGRWERA